MPRVSCRARAARRSLMMVNGEFELFEEFNPLPHLVCPYCYLSFSTTPERDRHIMAKPECRSRHLDTKPATRNARRAALKARLEDEYKIAGPSNRPHPSARDSEHTGNEANYRYNDLRRWTDNGRTCRQPFVEHFPISSVGQPISDERSHPPNLKAYIKSCGNLANPRNMEAAELLMTTGLSGKGRTRHLQSSFVSVLLSHSLDVEDSLGIQYRHSCHDYQSCACKGKGKVPWSTDKQMLKDIDNLPHGPDWYWGDFDTGKGEYERTHTAYFRPSVDVIRDLIGNPAFKSVMRYAPERHWTSPWRHSRVYGEMWTGDWWWRRQWFLRDRRGTIVPVIIASDKTSMTKLSGNQSAYPVYLTIGNISKTYRRQASKHATVIIGYLPIDEFSDVPGKVLRTRLKGELVHRAMKMITEPLEKAGREGVEMWCADGRLRRCYPLLAAFVGDWPEQCEMACVVGSGCPKCLKRRKGRGNERRAGPRTRLSTLAAVGHYLQTGRRGALDGLKLKPWWPWWANLPGAEFAECITPDLLHQLHKGLFKGHVMRWVQRTVGKKRIDKRFTAMTRATGMRHFKKGISGVQQWTGREAKEMMKVFVPLLAEDNAISDELVSLIRSIIDFSYIAHSTRLTDGELDELEEAHAEMHRLKHSVVDAGIYEGLKRFDRIAKWHMVSHYAESIRELGTPDGYNTEAPEYLHIVYVKRGWNASNKRDAIPQIIKYCQRLEALRIHRAYLNEYYGEPATPRKPTKTAVWVADDDGEYNREEEEDDPWEDDELALDDEGEEGARRASTTDANSVDHPAPEFAIAIRPYRRATMSEIADDYGATSLERALTGFLRPYAHCRYFILPNKEFDVWQKVTLYHRPLSFAPDEPLQRNVIRARPAVRDARNRVLRRYEPAFDTALFLHDTRQFGLHRYRAGRVRAIFRLPERLHYLYSGELVYLELFAPFSASPIPNHSLYTTSVARASPGTRRGIVVPIQDLALACHLAPRFRRVPRGIGLDSRADLLNDTRHFFFNHYYNYYTFQLLRYWQHHVETAT
ncbi:hypothetical protein FRC12_007023 [Ceratobasidium sp. 428]|nr:hypothetical protein FRC12_007023 [Ceratobasidium sp. 428]